MILSGSTYSYDIVIVTFNRLELLKECISCANGQTIKPYKIIVINNASTDNTEEYLNELTETIGNLVVVNMPQNCGGAGGFYEGIKNSLNYNSDWLILIDDDAILRRDYWEKITAGIRKYPHVKSFAGTVLVNGQIDTGHRSKILTYKRHIRYHKKIIPVNDSSYYNHYTSIDGATFCGLVVKKDLIRKIGLPKAEYFIWNDDMEYCMRIRKYSKIVNVNDAFLDHKTTLMAGSNKLESVRYVWKEYYRIRNRIDISKIYDGRLKTAKLCSVYMREALKCLYRSKTETQHMDDWHYNYVLLTDAIRDGIEHRMGKNIKYI